MVHTWAQLKLIQMTVTWYLYDALLKIPQLYMILLGCHMAQCSCYGSYDTNITTKLFQSYVDLDHTKQWRVS